MRYSFICEDCGIEVKFYRSIKEGPPPEGDEARNCPDCGQEMTHDLGGCNFILKGSWPGKDITRDNERSTTAERAERMFHEHKVANDEAKEVLAERRKGTESFKQYEKRNGAKVRRYWDNRKKGIVNPK